MNNLKRSVFEAALATTKKIRVFILDGGEIDLPGAVFLNEKGEPKGYAFLEYGLNMPIPIPDLESGPDGIRATLSFHYDMCQTFVPWGNVGMIAIPETGFTSVWNNMGQEIPEKTITPAPRAKLTLV